MITENDKYIDILEQRIEMAIDILQSLETFSPYVGERLDYVVAILSGDEDDQLL